MVHQRAPGAVHPQLVHRVHAALQQVHHLPDVVDAVAVGGDQVGELQPVVDNRHRLLHRVVAVYRSAVRACVVAHLDEGHVEIAENIVALREPRVRRRGTVEGVVAVAPAALHHPGVAQPPLALHGQEHNIGMRHHRGLRLPPEVSLRHLVHPHPVVDCRRVAAAVDARSRQRDAVHTGAVVGVCIRVAVEPSRVRRVPLATRRQRRRCPHIHRVRLAARQHRIAEPACRRVVADEHIRFESRIHRPHRQPRDAVAPLRRSVVDNVVAVGILHPGVNVAHVGAHLQRVVQVIGGMEHQVHLAHRRAHVARHQHRVHTLRRVRNHQLVYPYRVAHAVFTLVVAVEEGHEVDVERRVHPVAHIVVHLGGESHRRVARGVRRGINHKGRIVDPVHRVALQLVGRHQAALLAHQLRIQRQLPLENIAVVATPAVQHLDIPVPVHRAPHQRRKVLLRMVEVGPRRNVRRIDGIVPRVGHDVPAAVDNAVARRVLVAVGRIAAPAVVPARASLVARRRRVARIQTALLVDRKTEIRPRAHVALPRVPSTVARRNRTVARRMARAAVVHQRRLLPVRTRNVDIQVPDVRMLHVQAHKIDIVRVADNRRVAEILESHRRTVRTAHVAARHTVRQKRRLRIQKRRPVVHHHHLVSPRVAHPHSHRISHARRAVHRHAQNPLPLRRHGQRTDNQHYNICQVMYFPLHNHLQRYKKYYFLLKKIIKNQKKTHHS